MFYNSAFTTSIMVFTNLLVLKAFPISGFKDLSQISYFLLYHIFLYLSSLNNIIYPRDSVKFLKPLSHFSLGKRS